MQAFAPGCEVKVTVGRAFTVLVAVDTVFELAGLPDTVTLPEYEPARLLDGIRTYRVVVLRVPLETGRLTEEAKPELVLVDTSNPEGAETTTLASVMSVADTVKLVLLDAVPTQALRAARAPVVVMEEVGNVGTSSPVVSNFASYLYPEFINLM
jgi:hypothetical protein